MWLLTERGRKDVIINFELMRVWGLSNQTIVEQYNKTIKQ